MFDVIPVSLLRSGEIASVSQVLGIPEQVRRLEELGLIRGTAIEMVRGGSPCILRVDGGTLCFREDESIRIMVSPRKSA
jgi:ferrous iron transport protein A